ncbi:cell division protein FtsQ/DivIB [Candidatus Hydrogenosomobacter endosymbioticus]|uniref:Cell division protein FtsQ n=1 Tax=Candidatus Hydrogenosomobacter endosymbioticus TaxID=2558174 RepID=A0ABM7V8C6_9PROT|nr:FtsQ-type POTRA domain-containing protein [Candidatus Hydrogenosomobacter endosymbioticus]BDB96030.1 hypothetical protein HYD_1630 [Candidatus Hydrogenosomobacter endosymbioticus]
MKEIYRLLARYAKIIALMISAFLVIYTLVFPKTVAKLCMRTSKKIGFSLKDVIVDGRSRTTTSEICAALGARIDDPILSIDIEKAKNNLQQLPWISSASIERWLPRSLYIRISERIPMAVWQVNGKFFLIDRSGTTIKCDENEFPQDMITIVGEQANSNFQGLLQTISKFQRKIPKVVAAVFLRNHRWNLHLENGIVVKLPETDTEEALNILCTAFESLSNKNIPLSGVASIDLRFAGSIVIEPKGQPLKQSDEKAKAE